jgi:UDP-N-acetylmuramoylalanine--D-glutamate ligase
MTYFEELINTKPKQPSTMVAGISSKVLQIRKESIKLSLSDLNTVDHRQEYIATVDGVMYYDDSRAENVNATWFTFQNIVKPVVWIAGGDASAADFKDLKKIVKQKVKAMVCVGEDNAKLKKAFHKDITDLFEVESIDEAVNLASLLAQDNDIVLFSPACKSAIGETYTERGNQFTETVRRLEHERHQ